MIVDHLKNAGLYRSMGERFSVALDWLQKQNFATMESRQFPIRGKEIYAILQRYEPRSRAEAQWEAHRKYFDIQYVATGRERMGYAPLDTLTQSKPYNPESDVVMLTGSGDFINAPQGALFILGPDDAHMPAIAPEPGGTFDSEVTKVVVKVAVD